MLQTLVDVVTASGRSLPARMYSIEDCILCDVTCNLPAEQSVSIVSEPDRDYEHV